MRSDERIRFAKMQRQVDNLSRDSSSPDDWVPDDREPFPHEREAIQLCETLGIGKGEGAALFKEWNGLVNGGYRVELREFFRRNVSTRGKFRVEPDAQFSNVHRLVRR